MDLEEAIATTRAIRRYTDESVGDDDLAAILFAASRAPTGSNRQPYRFVVLRDGPRAVEAKALLGRAFRAAWGEKAAADGYSSGSGADASSPKARMARTMQRFVDRFEDTPVVVLPCYRPYRSRPDRTDGASVYPAVQNLLLAARARGLGGVITMWHQLVEAELKALLGVPDEVVLMGCVALGHPEGSHGPVRRRPLAELVYEDAWGASPAWAVDPPGTRFTKAGPRSRGAEEAQPPSGR